MNQLNQKLILFLIAPLFIGCQLNGGNNPNAITEPLLVENVEVGWKMEVPAGWAFQDEETLKAQNEKGKETIKEAINLDINAPELINLLNITKNESNILAISAEPFFEEFIREWEVTNNYIYGVIELTYQSIGMTPEVSPMTTEEIGGVEFSTYSVILKRPEQTNPVKQQIFTGFHNGYSITAALTYTDEMIKDEMVLLWKSSLFDIRETPDSVLANNAKMNSIYSSYILEGDGAFAQQKFTTALFWYQKAIEINPLDEYAEEQLLQCNLLAEDLSQEQLSKLEMQFQYKKVLAKADGLFEIQEYEQAISYYQRALAVNPSEQYPKEKITEAQALIVFN